MVSIWSLRTFPVFGRWIALTSKVRILWGFTKCCNCEKSGATLLQWISNGLLTSAIPGTLWTYPICRARKMQVQKKTWAFSASTTEVHVYCNWRCRAISVHNLSLRVSVEGDSYSCCYSAPFWHSTSWLKRPSPIVDYDQWSRYRLKWYHHMCLWTS